MREWVDISCGRNFGVSHIDIPGISKLLELEVKMPVGALALAVTAVISVVPA